MAEIKPDYINPFSRKPLNPHGLPGFLEPSVKGFYGELSKPWAPPVDIFETEHEVVIEMDLPGVDPNRVNIVIENGSLTLKGERVLTRVEHKALRLERSHGRFARAFTLPESIDSEQVRADYNAGVLTVTLPKKGFEAVIELNAQPLFQGLHVRWVSDPQAAMQRFEAALGERAWMLKSLAFNLFSLEGVLLPATIDAIVESALPDSSIELFLPNDYVYTGEVSDLVLLALYPSHAVRSISGIVKRGFRGLTLSLDDFVALIDPDYAESETIPPAGLPCSLTIAALKPLAQ